MYLVGIYVWRGRVYLPLQARFQSGIWTDVEPVYETELNSEEIVAAIEKVIAAGHEILPDPTREEWQKREDPVLAITKARNWKALARNGASYSIDQTNNTIRLDMSYTDEKGRWQNDPEKVRMFSKDTPLEEIVQIILEDIRSRPEVL